MNNSRKMALSAVAITVFSLCLAAASMPQANAVPMIPTIDSYDSAGNQVDVFSIGEDAYAQGSGFSPNTLYNVLVFDDGVCPDHSDDIEWYTGMVVPTARLIACVPVSTDGDGNLPLTKIVTNVGPTGQAYDLMVDVNGNCVYDAFMDALDANDDVPPCDLGNSGFFVVPEYSYGALAALAACIGAFAIIKRKDLHIA
ncbi:MAG: hypothetical protein NWF04_02720 [Candidatus Bathyarchaeota archaeon]|nr:hypothetical protein [Candidatus Bathyarchaeota archaeon]